MNAVRKRRMKRKIRKHMNIIIYTVIFTGTVIFTVMNASGNDNRNIVEVNGAVNTGESDVQQEVAALESSADRNLLAGSDLIEPTGNVQAKSGRQEELTALVKAGSDFTANVPSGSCVNIRKSASAESDIIGRMYIGAGGTVVEYGDQWTKISSGSVKGYVNNEFLTFGKPAAYTAVSIEEERRAEEEAARQEQAAEESNTSDTESETERPVQPSTTEPVVETKPNLTKSDAYLLACIVYCESRGESYQGQLAVANVVLNRLRSGRWGSSVSSVVYAPGQFAPVADGAMAQAVNNGPSASAINAANAALCGSNNIGTRLFFRTLDSGDYTGFYNYQVIGNHVFY